MDLHFTGSSFTEWPFTRISPSSKSNICEHGKEERRPIGHTFTDKEGEFVFGPLCPGKEYALQIWVNDTKKIKICAKCHHEGKCLKGDKCDKCDCFIENDKHDECEKPCECEK